MVKKTVEKIKTDAKKAQQDHKAEKKAVKESNKRLYNGRKHGFTHEIDENYGMPARPTENVENTE